MKTPMLSDFHPLLSRWFLKRVGTPTSLQEEAWPLIAEGEHVLLCAPTGSGKTFAAFLWAMHRLIMGEWPLGKTSVLYVSPLKALNNDIQRNLLTPLKELRGVFEESGLSFPDVRVLTRSGDTPAPDRRRMQRHPPEILITTPESLNLLLSSPISRNILTAVATVILDEIHAVVGSKRGTHLITAVDRIVPLAGEFQRIALSATIEPMETVARFVGGFRLEAGRRYSPRNVRILRSSARKEYEIRVRYPEKKATGEMDSFWQAYVDELRPIIRRNRSTLIFANSRRLSEKITHLINLDEEKPLAYAHHGSLSREIRAVVEQKLKDGELRAIVATNSLELGIDIGALDEVILLQSPPSISSAIQRIGRAGHRVGEVSRATLLPTDPRDLVEAAVLVSRVLNHKIERTSVVENPLDVLAQVIVSMAATDTWDCDRLFDQVRTSYPYRDLSRTHFDLVLEMLAGRFAASRLRELEPRVSLDRIDHTVRSRRGAAQLLYSSGGTIPDRGYYHLRHRESNARIGELDEEFVWEAKIGQVFTLGAQNWRIEQITHNDVFVMPADPRRSVPPFWKAEERLRDFAFSEGIARFMEMADGRLDETDFAASLSRTYSMEEEAAEQLVLFLRRQKEVTRSPLPHRHHLLAEFVATGPGGYPGTQAVLHTLWGGRVNTPFAMALEAAWESRYGHRLEVYPSNDSILLQLPHDCRGGELLSLVTTTNVVGLLRKRLEGSGFFGARFRECAGRALLLTRRRFNERMPLWMNRLRSQKLLDAVLSYEDFPILLEAWRTCLRDEFDLDSLFQVLSELESGQLAWSETRTASPSPMTQSATWPQINRYMYEDDRIKSGKSSGLRTDLIHDVVFAPELRPAVSKELARSFEKKRMRLAEGYAPDTAQDLLDWVKERVLIPLPEWEALLGEIRREGSAAPEGLLQEIGRKLIRIHPALAERPLVAALERWDEIGRTLYPGEDVALESFEPGPHAPVRPIDRRKTDEQGFPSLISEWFRFYGPVTSPSVAAILGLDPARLERAIEDLMDQQKVITGRLLEGAREELLCDAENFEILLRLSRAEARPRFEPLEIARLQPFVATWQGLPDRRAGVDPLLRSLEQLSCRFAPASAWETEIFPARLRPYDPAWLDSCLQANGVIWLGKGERSAGFCFRDDLDLLEEPVDPAGDGAEWAGLFPDARAKYDFSTLLHGSTSSPSELAAKLWQGVWEGRITNDSFQALRRGIETAFRFDPKHFEKPTGSMRNRSRFSRWKGSVPLAGSWQRLKLPPVSDDRLEQEERNKDRARLLLDRYGLLFRELLQYELPLFRWQGVFRALRLMELSGEVLTGYFFQGIPGPQFISHEAFRRLQKPLHEDQWFWLAANDPASLCGVPVKGLKKILPRRVGGTHLVFHGSTLALVSQQGGKRLRFHVPPDYPAIPSSFEFLHVMMTRRFQPVRRVVIETINGEPAAASPYAEPLRDLFELSVGHRSITLFPKHV